MKENIPTSREFLLLILYLMTSFRVPQESGSLRRLGGKTVCRRCHPRCKNCTTYGFHIAACHECMRYRRGEHCEDECPRDHYADDALHECIKVRQRGRILGKMEICDDC